MVGYLGFDRPAIKKKWIVEFRFVNDSKERDRWIVGFRSANDRKGWIVVANDRQEWVVGSLHSDRPMIVQREGLESDLPTTLSTDGWIVEF